jgi:hypothetical protein
MRNGISNPRFSLAITLFLLHRMLCIVVHKQKICAWESTPWGICNAQDFAKVCSATPVLLGTELHKVSPVSLVPKVV